MSIAEISNMQLNQITLILENLLDQIGSSKNSLSQEIGPFEKILEIKTNIKIGKENIFLINGTGEIVPLYIPFNILNNYDPHLNDFLQKNQILNLKDIPINLWSNLNYFNFLTNEVNNDLENKSPFHNLFNSYKFALTKMKSFYTQEPFFFNSSQEPYYILNPFTNNLLSEKLKDIYDLFKNDQLLNKSTYPFLEEPQRDSIILKTDIFKDSEKISPVIGSTLSNLKNIVNHFGVCVREEERRWKSSFDKLNWYISLPEAGEAFDNNFILAQERLKDIIFKKPNNVERGLSRENLPLLDSKLSQKENIFNYLDGISIEKEENLKFSFNKFTENIFSSESTQVIKENINFSYEKLREATINLEKTFKQDDSFTNDNLLKHHVIFPPLEVKDVTLVSMEKIEVPEIYRQIGRQIMWGLQNGQEKIKLFLDPPELGHIHLEIKNDQKNIEILLWTDHPETKQILESNKCYLYEILKNDGFNLEKFELYFQQHMIGFQEHNESLVHQDRRFQRETTEKEKSSLEEQLMSEPISIKNFLYGGTHIDLRV